MKARPGPFQVSSIAPLRRQIQAWRSRGNQVVFVPTMGALHEGHRKLIERAAGPGRKAVVSIFVNPTQFGPGEDFSAYPRRLREDLNICREAGAALVFTPAAETLYPSGFSTTVHVSGLDKNLCAPWRPGHFDGVCTIVLKLLNVVTPHRLILGQKDAQQAVIVGRMIRDLELPVTLDVAPTVRDRDGLALSSRNRYLSAEERRVAPKLHAALDEARRRIRAGERDAARIGAEIESTIAAEPLFRPQYVEVVDSRTLEKVERISGRVIVALAVYLGRARLIDNVVVTVPAERSRS